MKDVEFEYENNNNYMVISSENENNNIFYQQKMIEKNDINGLLKVSVKIINNQKKYYYNITSRHKITQVYEVTKLNYEDVKRIISSLSLVILEIKSYMLDIDCLFLDPQYMYMNMSAKSIEFVYYPEKSFDFDSSLKTLFEYILEKYDHNSDKMQLMNVYSIYQKIVQGQYDINNLMQLFVDERYNVNKSEKIEKKENVYNNEDFNDIQEDKESNNKNCEEQEYKSVYENITSYSERIDNNVTQNNKYNKDNTNQAYNGTVIKGVMPETIDNECEVKSSIENYINIVRTFFMIISVYIIMSYFIKQIAIVELNIYMSCIIAMVLLIISSYLTKLVKGQRFAGKLVNKTIQKEFVINNKNNNVNKKLDNDNNINNSSISEKYDKNITNNCNDSNFKSSNIINDIGLDNNDVVSKNEEIPDEFNSGNTILLSDYIKSNNDNDNKNTILKLKNDDNEIQINSFPFIIGSMKEYCMYVIENKLISRIHICLLLKDEKLYIQDMNSTNGTFLNDKRLNSGEESLLNNGDIIRLANESYVVEL